MPVLILSLLIAAISSVGGFLSSVKFRHSLLNVLMAAGNYAAGTLPSWRDVWLAIRKVSLALTILLLASWGLIFATFFTIGLMHNAAAEGFVLGLLFPIWYVLFILKTWDVKVVNVFFIITSVILSVYLILFSFAFVLPETKLAMSKKWDFLDRQNQLRIIKETAGAKFVSVKDSAILYNQNVEPIQKIDDAQCLMLIGDLLGQQLKPDTEEMVNVRMQDENGDYLGKEGWVPIRRINETCGQPSIATGTQTVGASRAGGNGDAVGLLSARSEQGKRSGGTENTSVVNRDHMAEREADFRQKYTSSSGAAYNQSANIVAVLVMDSNLNKQNNSLSSTLKSVLSESGFVATTTFFKQPIISDGLFQRLYDADPTLIRKLQLDSSINNLLLGVYSYNVADNVYPGVFTANGEMSVRFIDTKNTTIIEEFTVTEVAAGVTHETALHQLNDKIKTSGYDIIKQKLKRGGKIEN